MHIYLLAARCFGLQVNIFIFLMILFLSSPVGSLETSEAYEEMIQLINSIREGSGMANLFEEDVAAITAQNHATDLAGRQILSHFDSENRRVAERYRLNKGTGSYVGENLGVGYSIKSIFNAWLQSTSHKNNILNPIWARYGMGVEFLSDKRILFVLVFSVSRLESVTTEYKNNSLVIWAYVSNKLPLLNTKPVIKFANRKYKPKDVQYTINRQQKIQYVITDFSTEEAIQTFLLIFYVNEREIITDLFFIQSE